VDRLFATRPVLAVAFKGVFSHLDWELDDKLVLIKVSQNKKNLWERFPSSFISSLKEALGAEKFESLTVLAENYNLFDQALFTHPEDFTDIYDELTNMRIAAFLTSLGDDLGRRHIIDDAEKASRIVLTLRPSHFAARAMLAQLCCSSGRLSEAKEHARRAMTDMDIHFERYKDINVPKHITDPQAVSSLRSLLQSIAEGKTFDKAGTVTTPPSHREITLNVIDRLDLILYELSKVILSQYVERFPDEINKYNFTRIWTVVNELVKEELRGKQITFKANNPDFVAEEKNKLLQMEKVRKGVVSFLVAKAALYNSWGHSDADIWIERAKELEPEVEIPDTLDEISKVIENCLLSYYKSC